MLTDYKVSKKINGLVTCLSLLYIVLSEFHPLQSLGVTHENAAR